MHHNITRQGAVVQENFCAACLALPLAFAGAAGTTASSMATPNEKKAQEVRRKWILWGSIALTIVSAIAFLWYINRCKSCRVRWS